jgi:hypothetical protein
MAELEVDAQDVVRLMLQFCKENGLKVSRRGSRGRALSAGPFTFSIFGLSRRTPCVCAARRRTCSGLATKEQRVVMMRNRPSTDTGSSFRSCTGELEDTAD